MEKPKFKTQVVDGILIREIAWMPKWVLWIEAKIIKWWNRRKR